MEENAESHAIDKVTIRATTMVPLDEYLAVAESESRLSVGHFGFSLPAITEDGRALVYATYDCGTMCGGGWIILLEHYKSGWKVVACDKVWIS
jgi:hypothetical protein